LQASDQAPSRKCVACGNPLPERAMVCPLCGHDYRAALRGTRRTKTPFPEIGGAVIATTGIFQVIMGLLMITNIELANELLDMNLQMGVVYLAAAMALLVVGPLVVLGGALAMQRRSLALSTIGAVLATGVYVSAFLYGTATVGTGLGLGLVGLILIVASKDEFTS
jgi:hypothetical protein